MKTLTRTQLVDRRRFLAALSAGKPDIGFGPQCLALGPLPSAVILGLCEAIEPLTDGFIGPVQAREQIARLAKRHGASVPALHVRLSDAIANVPPEHESAAAALILAAVNV